MGGGSQENRVRGGKFYGLPAVHQYEGKVRGGQGKGWTGGSWKGGASSLACAAEGGLNASGSLVGSLSSLIGSPSAWGNPLCGSAPSYAHWMPPIGSYSSCGTLGQAALIHSVSTNSMGGAQDPSVSSSTQPLLSPSSPPGALQPLTNSPPDVPMFKVRLSGAGAALRLSGPPAAVIAAGPTGQQLPWPFS